MNDKPSLITVNSPDREAWLNSRPLIRHLTHAAGFLGVGALVHAWLLGPDFDKHNLWSWGYVLAWPVPLFFWLASVVLLLIGYAAVISIGCGFLWVFYCWVIDRRGLRTERWWR